MKTVIFVASFCLASSLDNGLARTPILGWNSWNYFACSVNETIMQETADAIAENFSHLGYLYVNIDDCWAQSREYANNTIIPGPNFPSGLRALSDYIHERNLKMGLYSDLGYNTCGGRPGSLHYETDDANTYIQTFNADYVKVDNCNTDGSSPESRYPVMRDALLAAGEKNNHQMVFSMCEWGVDYPARWASEVGNSWRTTGDISDHWSSMTSNLDLNEPLWPFAGPGGWNDPDMLEVGNGGMTTTEYITHFSLWAAMKSPLIIGCDVRNLSNSSDTYRILSNTEVIAVNQDPLGIQARRVWSQGLPDAGAPLEQIEKQRQIRNSKLKSTTVSGNIFATNTVITSCSQGYSAFQSWTMQPNSTITESGDGRCLDIDFCAHDDTLPNNVSVYPCTTPAWSDCKSLNEMWSYVPANGSVISTLSGQCLTVDPRNGYSVATLPCSGGNNIVQYQVWNYNTTTGQLSINLPSSSTTPSCLSVFEDVNPGATEVWSGVLSNNAYVVLLVNRSPNSATITANWDDIGVSVNAGYNVRDLWLHQDMGVFSGSYSANVPSHGTVVLKFTPA